MRRLIGAVVTTVFLSGLCGAATAADAKDVQATLDRAIQALGGKDKLGKIKAVSLKSKGTLTLNGNDNEFTSHVTAEGLDHYRQEFEGQFQGNAVKAVTVLAGEKGWRKVGDNSTELDRDGVANQKRTAYLQVIPVTILPLTEKGFKVEPAGEEKVGDKAAVVLRVTPPDGKDFTLSFDKESGLPVKLVAKVVGFRGEEFTQETTYSDYKDFEGIKKATRVESKRDGEKFIQQQLTEFKTLDKVPAETFAEPQ
jgi:hypothetical protein